MLFWKFLYTVPLIISRMEWEADSMLNGNWRIYSVGEGEREHSRKCYGRWKSLGQWGQAGEMEDVLPFPCTLTSFMLYCCLKTSVSIWTFFFGYICKKNVFVFVIFITRVHSKWKWKCQHYFVNFDLHVAVCLSPSDFPLVSAQCTVAYVLSWWSSRILWLWLGTKHWCHLVAFG